MSSRTRCTATVASLLLLALAWIACGGDGLDAPTRAATAVRTADIVIVRLGDLEVRAEVARTPAARAQGLSGRTSLAPDAGMLFVFETDQRPAFWMKGMRFPLDFVWISSDLRVVEVTADVPPPEPGTPDSALPRYQPFQPVRYVLEVNAGVAERAGVRPGDTISITVGE